MTNGEKWFYCFICFIVLAIIIAITTFNIISEKNTQDFKVKMAEQNYQQVTVIGHDGYLWQKIDKSVR